jgi:hypothetical protein
MNTHTETYLLYLFIEGIKPWISCRTICVPTNGREHYRSLAFTEMYGQLAQAQSIMNNVQITFALYHDNKLITSTCGKEHVI